MRSSWLLFLPSVRWWTTAVLLRKLAAAPPVCTSRTPPWRNSTAKDEFTRILHLFFFFLVALITSESVSLTVASFCTESSEAPSEARPISCENWAKLGSASSGTWPSSSWHVSLGNRRGRERQSRQRLNISRLDSCSACYSRFWGVQGLGAVADILGAVENTES